MRLELDAAGRFHMRGGAPAPRDPESARRHPFEFIEERRGDAIKARAARNPDAPYYRSIRPTRSTTASTN